MRVETGGLVFDDDDKRCTIMVKAAERNDQLSF